MHAEKFNAQAAALFEVIGHIGIGLSRHEGMMAILVPVLNALDQQRQYATEPSWGGSFLGAAQRSWEGYAPSLTLNLLQSITHAGLPWLTAACIGTGVLAQFLLPRFTPELTQQILHRVVPLEWHETFGPWLKSCLNLLLHLGMPHIRAERGRIEIECPNGTKITAFGGVLLRHNAHHPSITDISLTDASGRTEYVQAHANVTGDWSLSGENPLFTQAMATQLKLPLFKLPEPDLTPAPSEDGRPFISAVLSLPLLLQRHPPLRVLGLHLLKMHTAQAQTPPLKYQCKPHADINICLPEGMHPALLAAYTGTAQNIDTLLSFSDLAEWIPHAITNITIRAASPTDNRMTPTVAVLKNTRQLLIFTPTEPGALPTIMQYFSQTELTPAIFLSALDVSHTATPAKYESDYSKLLMTFTKEVNAMTQQSSTSKKSGSEINGLVRIYDGLKTSPAFLLELFNPTIAPFIPRTLSALRRFISHLNKALVSKQIQADKQYNGMPILIQDAPDIEEKLDNACYCVYTTLKYLKEKNPLLHTLIQSKITQIEIHLHSAATGKQLDELALSLEKTHIILRLDRIPTGHPYLENHTFSEEMSMAALRITSSMAPIYFNAQAKIVTERALAELPAEDLIHKFKHRPFPEPMILHALLSRNQTILQTQAPETYALLGKFIDIATKVQHPTMTRTRQYKIPGRLWLDIPSVIQAFLTFSAIAVGMYFIKLMGNQHRPTHTSARRPISLPALTSRPDPTPAKAPKKARPVQQQSISQDTHSVSSPAHATPPPEPLSPLEEKANQRSKTAAETITELQQRGIQVTRRRIQLADLNRTHKTEPKKRIHALNRLIAKLIEDEIAANQLIQADLLKQAQAWNASGAASGVIDPALKATGPAGAGSDASISTTAFLSTHAESLFSDQHSYALKRGWLALPGTENHQTLVMNDDLDEVAKYYENRAKCIAEQRTPSTDRSTLPDIMRRRNNLLMHGGIFIPEIAAMQSLPMLFNDEKTHDAIRYLESTYFNFETARAYLPALFSRRLDWLRKLPADDTPKHTLAREGILSDLGEILEQIAPHQRAEFIRAQDLNPTIILNLRRCRNSISHISIGPESDIPMPDNPALIRGVLNQLCPRADPSPAPG